MQRFSSRPSFETVGERSGRVRLTALALCAFTALVAAPVGAQLLVDPLEVTVTAAGARAAATFTVTNSSDR